MINSDLLIRPGDGTGNIYRESTSLEIFLSSTEDDWKFRINLMLRELN